MAEQPTTNEPENPDIARQNAGYDEAAHGGKDVPPSDVGVPPNPATALAATSSTGQPAKRQTTFAAARRRRNKVETYGG